MGATILHRISILAGLALFSLQSLAQSDQLNLEEGFGIQVEDAYATGHRNREVQLLSRYTRTSDGSNRVLLAPTLEYGFARNAEAELTVPVMTGNADRTGSGNIRVSALYNFNNEGLILPAFGLSGRAEFPTGKNSDGIDLGAKLLVTKTIFGLNRLHFNLVYLINTNPMREVERGIVQQERSGRFQTVIGYSNRLTPITVVLVDYFWEQMRLTGETSNMIELGLRQQATPRIILSAGGGIGIGTDSPEYRVSIGIQKAY